MEVRENPPKIPIAELEATLDLVRSRHFTFHLDGLAGSLTLRTVIEAVDTCHLQFVRQIASPFFMS